MGVLRTIVGETYRRTVLGSASNGGQGNGRLDESKRLTRRKFYVSGLFPVRRWFSDSLVSASGEAGFGSAP
jgi:hypothetical protein